MKKILTGLMGLVLLTSIAFAAGANSPAPYIVDSDNPVLKALFGTRHEFPGVFTAELSPAQVNVLNALGVDTEEVQLYHLSPPNMCGDGVCQGFESEETCPEDCSTTDTGISVSWVNPTDGEIVSGTVTIQIDASDSDGSIETVEWKVGDESYRTATLSDDSGYYEDTWDTTQYSDGDHGLTAKATDDTGNIETTSITVTVDNEADTGRTCYPDDQTPWGIEKVYGDTTITATSGGSGVDVAVLDTGVYKEHPDLSRRIEQCVDFTKGPRPKSGCEDSIGHGTHVAGTIAADGGSDGLGIFGVAPEADIFAYRVCGNSGCWTDDIAAAIDYAGSHGAEIVSMSLGGDTQSSLIKDAIDRNPDVLFVAAAGNDGPDEGSIDYPGAYVKVIAAGAIDVNEDVPDWSSRGVNNDDFEIEEREVEFGTPGVSVESAYNDGCYAYGSGTSMATPHVSGLAAKLWQGNAADTRTHLQSIAIDIWTEGDDIATGLGLPIAP